MLWGKSGCIYAFRRTSIVEKVVKNLSIQLVKWLMHKGRILVQLSIIML